MEGSREEGAHFPDAAPEYVAHISEDGERVESVETHLRQVAQLASTFADDFGAASWAYAAGIAHDIGKFPCFPAENPARWSQSRSFDGGCCGA